MYKLVLLFFFFLSSQAFAQKSCGCPEMDAFKKTRFALLIIGNKKGFPFPRVPYDSAYVIMRIRIH